MVDYVKPPDLVRTVVEVGRVKGELSVGQMLVRGFLSGAFLGYATSLAFLAWATGSPRVVGGIIFPLGFVLQALLACELATGNFAIVPMAVYARQTTLAKMLRNWFWSYVGNLIGGITYAFLFVAVYTQFWVSDGGSVGKLTMDIALRKTLGYASLGMLGWQAAMVSGVLCNWMVTLAAVMGFASTSLIGKTVVMWLPIFTFFTLGYEHSIVNTFVIPAGMFFGAPITIADWWIWNQIPVTIGNIIAGLTFTGGMLFYAHYVPSPEKRS